MGRSLRKVLVANRGEIALRVMRACREEGLSSVAVVSAAEDDPWHARYADEAIELVSEMALPYLDADAVLRAAIDSGADAIHPGYGFLAENARFADACSASAITFVGPSGAVIAAMGDKVEARRAASAAGVPIVPGSDGPVDLDGARAFAAEYGYPVALKATAGGGGRGFRVADSAAELQDALEGARGEARRYFNDDAVYVERYLQRPRHIEIQVMADQHGNVVALGERDCSIQRRHQKLIEETPSPALTADIRKAMNATSEALARSVGYTGAGTVEYLFSDGAYYFLEMNTRIQVEHPITEQVTGIDLVREQLRVAAGERLSFLGPIDMRGHAIECRINAEDPAREFAPSPGRLTKFQLPSGFGVRVDTGFQAGGEVDPRFDNLLAKLVVSGRDRDEALSRLERALRDFHVGGVATTIPLYQLLIRQREFVAGEYDTGYLPRSGVLERLKPFVPPADFAETEGLAVVVNGRTFRVHLPDGLAVRSRGNRHDGTPQRRERRESSDASAGPAGRELASPIQGTVLTVAVELGAHVHMGQLVCTVEAMKMENEVSAHRAGIVTELNVSAGQTVKTGQVLAVIDGAADH
jgi:acetyl-CoA/propionyl-CoA carboxylase biotin carboxyl carrier protein